MSFRTSAERFSFERQSRGRSGRRVGDRALSGEAGGGSDFTVKCDLWVPTLF